MLRSLHSISSKRSSIRSEAEQEVRIDVIHSIAAMLAHIGRAEFIAHELAALLFSAHKRCYVEVRTSSVDEGSKVIYTSGSREAKSGEPKTQKTFVIQSAPSRQVELVVELVSGIEATSALNAISTIIAALHELERAHAEREERPTLWPIEELPVDDDSSCRADAGNDVGRA